MKIRTRVQNLSTRRFPAHASYGRRLVRLGAQLCDPSGTLIELNHARAWLPAHLEGGAERRIWRSTFRRPRSRGGTR